MASVTTRDHAEIQSWAQAHGATPAVVSRTSGMLRFEFSPSPPSELASVGWGDFFRVFDEKGLDLIYDDKPGSRFHKFVYPETIAGQKKPAGASTRASVKPLKTAAKKTAAKRPAAAASPSAAKNNKKTTRTHRAAPRRKAA